MAVGPLIGRERELAILRSAVAEARAGTSRAVFIGGESGIGKTRLVTELIEGVRGDGVSVHRAACPPVVAATPVPFAPFTSILRSVLHGVDARLIEHLVGDGRRDLAGLLPELGDGDPASLTGPGAARLFEAALLLVERVARRSRCVLLCLDDLQWADDAGRTMLAWFSGELRDARVAIIGTYRSDLPLEHPLPPLLAELDRSVLVERLDLGPLTPDEAARLLADAAGGALDPGRQRELLRRAGGVPLYLEELALPPEAGVPASLQASVGARLARTGAHARSIIELLAVAEGPVTVGLLAAAAGMPPAGMGPHLTAAIDTGLVRIHGSTASEQSVVEPWHTLLAETVQARLGREALAHLHRRWADTLAANPDLGPRSPSERTARTAGHLLAAGEVERAVPALIAAGDAALAARAFGTADAFFGRALAIADHRPQALVPDPVALMEAAAMAALLAGSPRTAVARSARAAELAGAASGSLAAATRLVRHAELLRGAGETQGAIDALEEALAVLPPTTSDGAPCSSSRGRTSRRGDPRRPSPGARRRWWVPARQGGPGPSPRPGWCWPARCPPPAGMANRWPRSMRHGGRAAS